MTDNIEQAPEDQPGAQKKLPLLTRSRVNAAVLAIGGMLVGSLVGIGVQTGVESTGLLGPSVEALIAEQESNFTAVNARLDDLRGMASDPEIKNSLAELGKLLARQGDLANRANSELAYLGDQVDSLRAQTLADNGFAGGADFWLKTGESVTVGERGQVFGVVRMARSWVDVNLNGERARLTVGDTVEVPLGDRSCTVFYKQALPRDDGRTGFDLTCG